MALSASGAKIVSLVILFVVSLLVSILPLRYHKVVFRSTRTQIGMHFLSCVAGGIIFGTVLLHLIPEVDERFKTYTRETGTDVDYPVTEVTVGLGFMMVFLLEQVVLACRGNRRQDSPLIAASAESTEERVGSQTLETEVDEAVEKEKTVYGTVENQSVTNEVSGVNSHSDLHSHGFEMLTENPGIKEYAFAAALCLHALFEGLTLGFLEKTSEVFQLLVGLTLHKAALAITLVIQLVKSSVKWQISVALVIFFSFISPLGIIIGIAVVESGSTETESGKLAEAILQSVGTGTLLYVVVIGIILEEFGSGDNYLLKSFCVFAGYLVVAALAFLPEEEHDHCLCINGTES